MANSRPGTFNNWFTTIERGVTDNIGMGSTFDTHGLTLAFCRIVDWVNDNYLYDTIEVNQKEERKG